VECKDTVYTYGLASDIMRHVEQTCMEDFRVFHDAKGKCLDEYGFQKRVNELSVDDENCKTSGENCITGAYSDYRSCDDICYNNYYGKITSADSNEQREYWGNVYNGCVSDCRDDLGDSKKSCCTCYYEYRKKYYKTYRELFDCTAYLLDCFVDFSEFDVEDEYEEEEEEQYEEIDCQDYDGSMQATGAFVFDDLAKSNGLTSVTGYAGMYKDDPTGVYHVDVDRRVMEWLKTPFVICKNLYNNFVEGSKIEALREMLEEPFEELYGRKPTKIEVNKIYKHFNNNQLRVALDLLKDKDPSVRDILLEPSMQGLVNLLDSARRVLKEQEGK